MPPQQSARTTVSQRIAAVSRHVQPLACATAASGERRILSGIVVAELATVVAAPSCMALLADMGAEVLKVENPHEPDYVRAWRIRDDPSKTADPERFAKQVGSGFTQFNRGKRSIAIDYRTPEGLQVLKKLMSRADVFVTNVRPQGLKKAGLDYHSVSKEFPRLVYAHLSAWGLQGPRQNDPGYDIGAFFAYSGLMELARASDSSPLPRNLPAIGDLLTGTQLLAGIALALYQRQRTGEGQLVDVALMRAGIWSMSHLLTAHAAGNTFAAGTTPVVRGSTVLGKRATLITDGSFRCKDGRWILLLGVESRKHWTKTIKALDLEHRLDSNWATAREKTDWVATTSLVDEIIAQKTYQEWHDIFEAADVWHTPVNKYEDVMADDHANAAGSFVEVPGLQHKLVRNPIQLSSQEGAHAPLRGAPGFGEHTNEVLTELGFSKGDVAELRKTKAVA